MYKPKRFVEVLLFVVISLETYNVFGLIFVKDQPQSHQEIVQKYYERRKDWQTSNLGRILFKNDMPEEVPVKNITFKVLQWRYWGYEYFHSVYHLQNFPDPLNGCSVQNCQFSGGTNASGFDAVVVNIRFIELLMPPARNAHNSKQIWIWMSEEPPVVTEVYSRIPLVSNFYNWSMSYRTDSDIPMPYGRTVPLPRAYTDDVTNMELMSLLVPHWKNKKTKVLAAILTSHCDSNRMTFLWELQQHMRVDVYGSCSNDTVKKDACKTSRLFHYKEDCEPLNQYVFYIVMENNRCRQYLTEKVWHQAFSKGAIPVIRGAPSPDLESLLPPSSFINVYSLGSVKRVADYLKQISKSREALLYYHRWRNNFDILNEHNYFESSPSQSVPLCRICQALNYNSYEERLYDEDDMRLFFEPRIVCESFPF